MSTPAPTLPPPSPGFAALLAHFNTVAAVAAATIAQEQADVASHASFAQKLNDAVAGAATGLAAVVPLWGGDIALGLAAFQTGEAIVSSLVALFHHPKPPAATAATDTTAAPSSPAVSGAN